MDADSPSSGSTFQVPKYGQIYSRVNIVAHTYSTCGYTKYNASLTDTSEYHMPTIYIDQSHLLIIIISN